MNRREFIRGTIATVALSAVAVAGFYEIATKASAQQASLQQEAQQVQLPPATLPSQTSAQSATSQQVTSSQTPGSAPSGYTLVAQASSLAGKTSAYFTHPVHGSSLLLEMNGQWRAFSAVCTHRVCTLDFTGSDLYCPCHGATFSATDGSVTRGPAQARLGEYGVLEQNGAVYVSDAFVN